MKINPSIAGAARMWETFCALRKITPALALCGVNKLNISTIGAVVQPGANLMEIVPLDDTLLVEGRVRPQDIAFIRPDQDAVA